VELKTIPATALCAMLLTGCATAPAQSPLVFLGGTHKAGDSKPYQLMGNDLIRVANTLGVPDSTLNTRKKWWYVVGEMKSTGGWTWLVETDPNQVVRLCLMGPIPGSNFTMGFSAPAVLIGTDINLVPTVKDQC
jgi:hypothetical protein